MSNLRTGRFARIAALMVAAEADAQVAGVDLVASSSGVQVGVPCSPFNQTPHSTFVVPGQAWLFRVLAAPATPHLLVLGLPPTSPIQLPGIENLLLVHDPLLAVVGGITGPASSASLCGQGYQDYFVQVPFGPMTGTDYGLQALAFSSTTGNWAFTTLQWITYQ